MRRYLIIAAIVMVLAGVGAAVYFIFFTGSASVTVAPDGTSLPVAEQGSAPGETGTTIAPVVNAPVSVSARLVKISAGPVVPGAAVVNNKAVSASSSPPSSLEQVMSPSNISSGKAAMSMYT